MRTYRPRRQMSFSPTVDGLPGRFLPADVSGAMEVCLAQAEQDANPPLIDPIDSPPNFGDDSTFVVSDRRKTNPY